MDVNQHFALFIFVFDAHMCTSELNIETHLLLFFLNIDEKSLLFRHVELSFQFSHILFKPYNKFENENHGKTTDFIRGNGGNHTFWSGKK